MGTPIPPPPVVGDFCAHCDGVNWPAGQTPRFIKLRIEDFVACPSADYPAPDGDFVLEQDPGQPCKWTYDVTPYKWEVFFVVDGYIWGQMKRDAGGFKETYLAWVIGCASKYDNTHVACNGNVCKDGTAEILWS